MITFASVQTAPFPTDVDVLPYAVTVFAEEIVPEKFPASKHPVPPVCWNVPVKSLPVCDVTIHVSVQLPEMPSAEDV